jgi:lipopolysaccharide/colanic/teichoic acid biosynthesis glycosyltransferase
VFVPEQSGRLSLPDLAERAAGLFLLIFSAPILIASAIVISVLSRRSPFVAHLRVGQNHQQFWMLKLRSMWEAGGPARPGWIERVAVEPDENGKSAFDPRVSNRFASFCRRHSIDEIPQFWHVVRGEMSLVGPRPLTRTEVERYYGSTAAELLSVKPGLTGLWQVSGRSTIRFPHRADLDLQLVRELSPKLYFKIVIRTFSALIGGQGAW